MQPPAQQSVHQPPAQQLAQPPAQELSQLHATRPSAPQHIPHAQYQRTVYTEHAARKPPAALRSEFAHGEIAQGFSAPAFHEHHHMHNFGNMQHHMQRTYTSMPGVADAAVASG
eukprot:4709944-Pleurochrysis_carterae.AAC.2